jgi:hypothetical protein
MMMMIKRLPAALAAAALCSMVGVAQAQPAYNTDAPDATGQYRFQPAPPGAPTVQDVNPTATHADEVPLSRSEVRAETRAAMRENQIPHGEMSTPEQDKGAQHSMTPLERGEPTR